MHRPNRQQYARDNDDDDAIALIEWTMRVVYHIRSVRIDSYAWIALTTFTIARKISISCPCARLSLSLCWNILMRAAWTIARLIIMTIEKQSQLIHRSIHDNPSSIIILWPMLIIIRTILFILSQSPVDTCTTCFSFLRLLFCPSIVVRSFVFVFHANEAFSQQTNGTCIRRIVRHRWLSRTICCVCVMCLFASMLPQGQLLMGVHK